MVELEGTDAICASRRSSSGVQFTLMSSASPRGWNLVGDEAGLWSGTQQRPHEMLPLQHTDSVAIDAMTNCSGAAPLNRPPSTSAHRLAQSGTNEHRAMSKLCYVHAAAGRVLQAVE